LTPVFLASFQNGVGPYPPRLKAWIKKTFEFTPGNNIEHKIERTNGFVALVFGYSVVAILYQSSVAFGINGFFGKAVLGLIQSFIFNWLYFEVDTYNMHTHAIRRHFFSAFTWITIHLPFVMSFTLAAASLAKIVIAHDTSGTTAEDLLEPYSGRSEEELPESIWWFYCVGLGIALACTACINLSHVQKSIPNQRLTRPYRIAVRFAVSLVLILLPLARHQHLTSLDLVAITTSLVSFVLLVELLGGLCSGDAFWGFKERNCCSYSAHAKISRKELEAKMHSGEAVDVEELARKSRTKGRVDHDIIV